MPLFISIKKGIKITKTALTTSQAIITFFLLQRSTHTPAMGPIKKTGIIIKKISLA